MTNGGANDLEKELQRWFEKADRVVLVGIGNPLRMDDFAGVKIVQDLNSKVSERVMLIEAETVPENYVEQILDFKPTHVLLIDAAVMGLSAGGFRLMTPSQLNVTAPISTHAFPLRIFCELLQDSKSKIGLLLLEPKQTDFGENMSLEMLSSSRKVGEVLRKLLS